ncbi:MAG: Omp28-related outer membrane protein [Tidjanibacter sp.]|nr:Omp28-related outer membrane protein [Tidjanibacter sp.]
MKLKQLILFATTALLVVGCSGTPDNNEPTPTPNPDDKEEVVDPAEDTYTLVADKESVDADGVQKVTFSLLNGKGEDLCKSEPGMVKVMNKTTGLWLGYGKHSFASVRNGEYEFSATYRGYDAENVVKVKFENRGKYEKYRQSVVIYKATGAWCTACPVLTANLHTVAEEWGEQMIVVACHGGGADPFKLSPDVSAALLTQWKSSAYPSCVYDNNTFVSGAKDVENVKKNITEQISKYPATCGVKITEASLSGKTLTVKASVKSAVGGSYDLGCVLLEDNLYYAGGSEPSGVYSDVMRGLTGSFNYYNKATAVDVAADGEAHKEFTIEGLSVADPKNCKVVVFALVRLSNGQTVTDNAAVCKVGESMTAYVLNE